MRTRVLRAALATNCVFSALTGFSMLVFPVDVASWIEFNAPAVLQIVGVLLLLFAAVLLYSAWPSTRPQPIALLASFADFAWVVGTAALGIVAPSLFSPFGWGVATVVALIVLACGISQMVGIDLSYRDKLRPGWVRLCLETQMDVSPTAVWKIVSDLEAIADHSPMLASSQIISIDNESGLFTRQCHDTSGKCWTEKIQLNEEMMQFNAEFDAQKPGFPFPFAEMLGGWQIAPSRRGTIVKVWWSMRPLHRAVAFFILPIMEVLIRRSFRPTLANIRNAASTGARSSQATRQSGRLQMAVC